MSLTAVVKMSIGVSQRYLPGHALSRFHAPPAALSRWEQTPLFVLLHTLSLFTSKCQHITLLIGTISSPGARELTHSIIRIMIILISWGEAPQGKRCTINYTLAFWMNWLSDRVCSSLSVWMGVLPRSRYYCSLKVDPQSDRGSMSCGTHWRHSKVWRLQGYNSICI